MGVPPQGLFAIGDLPTFENPPDVLFVDVAQW